MRNFLRKWFVSRVSKDLKEQKYWKDIDYLVKKGILKKVDVPDQIDPNFRTSYTK